MRWLLSLIFVMVTLSSAFATETKTEYITEEVCHAVAGCWVDTKTGECPDCVVETRKIVTVVEDTKPTYSILPRSVVTLKKEEPEVKKVSEKMCFFPKMAKDRDKGVRACDWREDGNKTVAAIERGTKECGGYGNMKWTNRHRTEYICKG